MMEVAFGWVAAVGLAAGFIYLVIRSERNAKSKARFSVDPKSVPQDKQEPPVKG